MVNTVQRIMALYKLHECFEERCVFSLEFKVKGNIFPSLPCGDLHFQHK